MQLAPENLLEGFPEEHLHEIITRLAKKCKKRRHDDAHAEDTGMAPSQVPAKKNRLYPVFMDRRSMINLSHGSTNPAFGGKPGICCVRDQIHPPL